MRLTWLVGLWLVALGCTPEMAVDVVPVELSEIQVVTTDAQFVSVRDMAVDSRSVWILDARPPFLARVSLEGRATHVASHAR
jgi:hypothetical protein